MKLNKHLYKLITAILTALLVLAITQSPLVRMKFLSELELKTIDSRFSYRGVQQAPKESDVVIVAITDRTYSEIPKPYNKWPWPRTLLAQCIRNLSEAGAKVIGVDILLTESDQFSDNNDSVLYNTIKKYRNVVLAGQINENINSKYSVQRLNENFANRFYAADSSIGIVQVDNDYDGVLRRYIPYVNLSLNNSNIPTFAFALLNKFNNLSAKYTVEDTKNNFLFMGKKIPKYDNTSFLVNFYGTNEKFRVIDFIDVIDDKTFRTATEKKLQTETNIWDDDFYGYKNSNLFKNKIVIIGSANYLDKDIFQVAYSNESAPDNTGPKQEDLSQNRMYGVMYHATAVQNLIESNYIKSEPYALTILIIVLFTICSFYITSLLKRIKIRYHFIAEILMLALLCLMIYAVKYFSFLLFKEYSYLVSIINPALALFAGYISSSAYEFIAERKNKNTIKKMFSRYVSSDVVDELIKNPEAIKLKGETKYITALFSDIEGFSTFAEKMDPQTLVSFLNEYFDEMTKIVIQQNGTLDKFIGDSIMAFWGAPLPAKGPELCACKTALQMQKRLEELSPVWKDKGYPSLKVRIGINSGEMVVGNIGGQNRFNYTIMGNQVNIASRLEGINKNYGTRVIISQSTYQKAELSVNVRELGNIIPKGISREVKIYELTGIK